MIKVESFVFESDPDVRFNHDLNRFAICICPICPSLQAFYMPAESSVIAESITHA